MTRLIGSVCWILLAIVELLVVVLLIGFKNVALAEEVVYYQPTIRDLIRKDCGRCHTGGSRDLMDWVSVRTYVDSGMLETMLLGPMGRFAGPDTEIILGWITSGAPENPSGVRVGTVSSTVAAFRQSGAPSSSLATPNHLMQDGSVSGRNLSSGSRSSILTTQGVGQRAEGVATGPYTYTDPVQSILAERCLRCHSGPFRRMTTYEEIWLYVDNGLLEALIKPGGQMHRFAGPDTKTLLAWIQAGAPR